jgi:hypothetical protein
MFNGTDELTTYKLKVVTIWRVGCHIFDRHSLEKAPYVSFSSFFQFFISLSFLSPSLLLSRTTQPHTPQPQKLTNETSKVFAACDRGDVEELSSLPESVSFSIWDPEGLSPLHRAAMRGDVSVIKLLIYRGADLEIRTKDGFSVVQLLMQEDQDAALEVLIRAGVNLLGANTVDRERTALHYAALWNASKCAKVSEYGETEKFARKKKIRSRWFAKDTCSSSRCGG